MPRGREERHPRGSQTARLPSLHRSAKPNFNRKAQEIIAAHMYEDPSGASLVRGAPLLQQIDSTAPRTARSHDISHLQDRCEPLAPTLAASLLDKQDYVYEPTFLPQDSSSIYSDEDGMWHTLVFPSDKPSSRMDAVHLDAWITRSLAPRQKEDGQTEASRSVEELVNILSVALHEVSRQVTHHCVERGQALERIWKTYVELFDRVMRQMRELLTAQKGKTAEKQRQLALVREETKEIRQRHPQDMHEVICKLEDRFSEEQAELETEIKAAQEDGVRLKQELRSQHKEIEAWFPNFGIYQDSAMRNHFALMGGRGARGKARRSIGDLRRDAHRAEALEEDGVSPDVAIAEDFKRLLSVIAPDKRREIGQELADFFEVQGPPGPSVSRTPATDAHSDAASSRRDSKQRDFLKQVKEQKAMEVLQGEIKEQEDRIRRLRKEIMQAENKQRHSLSRSNSDLSDEPPGGAPAAPSDGASSFGEEGGSSAGEEEEDEEVGELGGGKEKRRSSGMVEASQTQKASALGVLGVLAGSSRALVDMHIPDAI